MANYCEHCGSELTSGSFYCQNCGAPVPQGGAAAQAEPEPSARRRVQTPRTIDELTAFCERHELPLAKMRFFIGLDYPGAKAFGIFQDSDGNFVVYKNKADGSRSVRYRGPDEAYAVNEIFQKLKEEAAADVEIAENHSDTPYVVFILGESTTRDRMHLYGYPLENTPNLDALNEKGELAVFRDTISPESATVAVLRKLLTFADMDSSIPWYA